MDYKDVDRLRRLVSDRGRIEPRRKTGLTAKDQRKLTRAIKRARHVALLPYTAAHLRVTSAYRQASRAARYDPPAPPAAEPEAAPAVAETPVEADAPVVVEAPEAPATDAAAEPDMPSDEPGSGCRGGRGPGGRRDPRGPRD